MLVPWEKAAITGGSVVVVAAGVAIGYLVFKRCRGHGSSGDGVRLEIITTQ
jgi:hypothetical protein